ncbi:MAG: thioesterase [Bdellovibrionaceae bacterium]|nr:thioesterase [Pseudobdellovibrionaceae bacterium]
MDLWDEKFTPKAHQGNLMTSSEKNKIYTGKYKVTTYDADPYGYAKPSSLMNYMQDASGMHAFQWGVSVFDLFTEEKTWVISRYHLQIFNRPAIGKEITIRTWPSIIQSLFALREFEAYDANDKLIANATISVALIDLKTKKPIPIDKSFPHDYMTPARVINKDFSPLLKITETTKEVCLPVMLRDLDANGHVNHVVYAQWALEAVPLNIWSQFHLTSIEINYKAEVLHGMKINSKVQQVNTEDINTVTFLHQIFTEDNQKELTRLKTTWQKK